ncbi:MAG: tail-specific protease [Gammaproteobacteria bacterium]|nr:tail-specific protease [Gammaproteobacteria bacterium]
MKILSPWLILLLLLLGSAAALAKTQDTPLDELYPSQGHRQASLIAVKVIDKYHYKRQHLDDAMSSSILDRYLDSLDPNKHFFTQSDIETFSIYRDNLDDALRQARVEPPFSIFKVYRQRVDERVDYAIRLLEQPMDFSKEDFYPFDREEVPWSANKGELNDVWLKRVKNDFLSLKLRDKTEEKIKDTLRKRYENLRRRTHQLNSDDIFQLFVNAYTLSLEPHTSYMSPRLSENFDISMRLSLEGIGAVLSSEDEYTVVQRVVTGGPAANSGKVKSGDRIVGVGQGTDGEILDVVGWRLQDVVDKIRGKKGSVVRLRLMKEDTVGTGPSRVIELVRNKIKLEDQAAKQSIIQDLPNMPPARIGVIDVPAFYRDFAAQTRGEKDFRSTTRDVRKLIQELHAEGVDGLVIDLRGNGGGSLVEATELTGPLINTGPVVQVKSADGVVEVERDLDPMQIWDGPLAVLVDRNSASASEIFAGAIQDYHRGIIIGEPTFGKGTVQTLVDLGRFVRGGDDTLGRLKLTMAQFFRINGGSTQFRGVVPDIVFPSATGSEEHGERGLDNALPWASIEAADFHPVGIGSVSKYRERHQQRIADDPGFIYLKESADWRLALKDKDSVSLNEEQRRLEWEANENRRLDSRNRYRQAIGLESITKDDEEKEAEKPIDPNSNEPDDPTRIALNEAARILADYIDDHRRAAMN